MSFDIITAEHDGYYDLTRDLIHRSWPEFMMHDKYIDEYWEFVFEKYPAFQFAYVDKESEKVIALGNSFPLHYNDDLNNLPDGGLDWALKKAHDDINNKRPVNTLCAFQIVIDPKWRGTGLSSRLVKEMVLIGRRNGFKSLIAPVRPNQKSNYPLTSMESYLKWQNESGYSFDAWIRVHQKLGAEIIKICPDSMYIEGTVSDWEEWTFLRFFESGSYVITGALSPVKIDCEKNIGLYLEPNVWMSHKL